jgi:(p)ppGpp synthase/HD superfamily hydrolase
MLDQMLRFAADRYAKGRSPERKYTGEPYIVHPVEVVGLLLAYVPDERYHTQPILAAAVGHDLYEDTDTTREEIVELFGHTTDILIWGLTDRYTKERYPNENRANRKRLEAQRLGMELDAVQTIKYADLISNTRDIALHDPKFGKVYFPEKRQLLMRMRGGNLALRARAFEVLTEAERSLEIVPNPAPMVA